MTKDRLKIKKITEDMASDEAIKITDQNVDVDANDERPGLGYEIIGGGD